MSIEEIKEWYKESCGEIKDNDDLVEKFLNLRRTVSKIIEFLSE